MAERLLEVAGLRTQFRTFRGVVRAVDGVSLDVDAGETVGVVGESGCGKTMLALSILRLVPAPGRMVAGSIRFRGRDVLAMDAESLRRLRGGDLAMSFQDPMSALNPLMRVGRQVGEALTAHQRLGWGEANARATGLLATVRVPAAEERAADYPHQFSGGMRQRAMIAMGLANEPELLIADEPTTALDVTAQAQMVRLLRELNDTLGTAIILISHDMAVVAGLCQRVVVMYAGRVVEDGPAEQVFGRPQHPYTWHLLRSLPRPDVGGSEFSGSPHARIGSESAGSPHARIGSRRLVSIGGAPPDLTRLPAGCTFHPRCRFRQPRCIEEEPPLLAVGNAWHARCWVLMDTVDAAGDSAAPPAPARRRVRSGEGDRDAPLVALEDVRRYFRTGRGVVSAVDGVSLTVRRGETLGLIGESGCGKSTLARLITGLLPASGGRVLVDGQDLGRLRPAELRAVRRQVQIIFQDPFSSLDPRRTVADAVGEPLTNFTRLGRRGRGARVREMLDMVGLGPDMADRYPHELSGGERQRVGIARALVVEPELVVCDEPVSALDVSIQAQIVNLLEDLQDALGLTYVFISHDIGLVRLLADRVAVMYLGKIVEVGEAGELYRRPLHPYTAALVDAIPVPDPRRERGRPFLLPLDAEPPSPLEPPPGCRFHTRCPIARVPGVCRDTEPPLVTRDRSGRPAACHFPGEDEAGGG